MSRSTKRGLNDKLYGQYGSVARRVALMSTKFMAGLFCGGC